MSENPAGSVDASIAVACAPPRTGLFECGLAFEAAPTPAAGITAGASNTKTKHPSRRRAISTKPTTPIQARARRISPETIVARVIARASAQYNRPVG